MGGSRRWLTDGDDVYPDVRMDERDDTSTAESDELWDPGAQRRDLLAMTMSERLELAAALFRQSEMVRTILAPRNDA